MKYLLTSVLLSIVLTLYSQTNEKLSFNGHEYLISYKKQSDDFTKESADFFLLNTPMKESLKNHTLILRSRRLQQYRNGIG
jgi:hypothetical protein